MTDPTIRRARLRYAAGILRSWHAYHEATLTYLCKLGPRQTDAITTEAEIVASLAEGIAVLDEVTEAAPAGRK